MGFMFFKIPSLKILYLILEKRILPSFKIPSPKIPSFKIPSF